MKPSLVCLCVNEEEERTLLIRPSAHFKEWLSLKIVLILEWHRNTNRHNLDNNDIKPINNTLIQETSYDAWIGVG